MLNVMLRLIPKEGHVSDALRKSLDKIQLRIKSAAERAGRDPDEIVVIAVTKTVGIETLKSLVALGWKDVGENRVNAVLEKTKVLPNNKFTWHMIGHLQGNKAKRAVGLFDYIHSLDSITLAEELQAEALKISKAVRVLIQVNVSGEATKSGIKPEELTDFYRKVKGIVSPSTNSGLIITGLMTMAPITDNPETVRPYFGQLRELRDKLKSDFIDEAASEELKYLSMGMSQDFEVAVEEGANMLRIGTAIFG